MASRRAGLSGDASLIATVSKLMYFTDVFVMFGHELLYLL